MNNDVTQSVCIKPNINEEFLLGSYLLHRAARSCTVLGLVKKKGYEGTGRTDCPAPLVPFQDAMSVIV